MANLQELDLIFLDPELTQFEILIYGLISSDQGRLSRAQFLFALALISRPDPLLLALSQLLSSGLSDLRAQAAKHLGEIFTKFFSSIFLDETTLDILKSNLLCAFRNEMSKSNLDILFRTISDFHATRSWPELLQYLFGCVKSRSYCLPEYALLVFKSLAENSNGNASLIPHLNTFKEIFSECLGNCWSLDVKIAALDASISFVQFIPNREDPNRFDYLLTLMMLTLTEAWKSGSEDDTEDSLHLLIELAKTDPRFFERQLEEVLRLMLKITVDDSFEVNIKFLAIKFLMELVEKAPRMISEQPRFIERMVDEFMYMLFDIEGFDDATVANAADANHTVAVVANYVAGVADVAKNVAKAAAKAARAAVDARAAARAAVDARAAARAVASAESVAAAAAAAAESVAGRVADFAAAKAAAAARAAAKAAAKAAAAARAAAHAPVDAVAAVASAESVVKSVAAAAAAAASAESVARRVAAAAAAESVAGHVADFAAAAAESVAAAAAAAASKAVTPLELAYIYDDRRLAARGDHAAIYAAYGAICDAADLGADLAADLAAESAVFAAAAAAAAADVDGGEVEIFSGPKNYRFGKKCLSKFSIFLGEEPIIPRVILLSSHLLGASTWQKRHAALIAMQTIAKSCNKVMPENLDKIVPGVLKSLNDPHPYVRLAAINAITQLSVDFGSKLQTQYHDNVLIGLHEVMKDFLRPKLQAAAASAALTFVTNGTENIIDLYMWKIIDEFRIFVMDKFFIEENFLRSELARIVSMLSSDTDGRRSLESLRLYLERGKIVGRRSGELHEEYLSRIEWLKSLSAYLGINEINDLERLRKAIKSNRKS